MTMFAVPGPIEAPPSPPHEHAWRLVQVDYTDGCCVREYACGSCAAVWFA